MTVLGKDVLRQASRRNAPLRKWLTLWVAAVENMVWSSLGDVRRSYPSADGVKLKSKLVVTVFNAKGNEYRLLSVIDYDVQTGNPGNLGTTNGFRALLTETLGDLTGPLNGATVADVGTVIVASHSGGYQTAAGIASRTLFLSWPSRTATSTWQSPFWRREPTRTTRDRASRRSTC